MLHHILWIWKKQNQNQDCGWGLDLSFGLFLLFFNENLSLPGLPWWLRWERICLQCRRPRFYPWVRKIPWRREGLPTPGNSCLENLTAREAWWTPVHGVWKSWINTTERLTLSAYHELLDFLDFFFSWRVKSHDSFDIGWHTGYRLCFRICFY